MKSATYTSCGTRSGLPWKALAGGAGARLPAAWFGWMLDTGLWLADCVRLVVLPIRRYTLTSGPSRKWRTIQCARVPDSPLTTSSKLAPRK